MTTSTTRRPPTGLARAVVGVTLALAALTLVAPAGPAAALTRVCPPSTPNCDPELFGKCPGGQPSCSPETVGLARNGWPDGTPGNTNLKCPGGQTPCDPES